MQQPENDTQTPPRTAVHGDLFLSPTHWRYSALPVRLLILDGRAAFPFVLWLAHISWPTFRLACGGFVFFGLLEYFRLPLPMFWRRVRSTLATSHRPGAPPRRLFI